MAKHVASLPFVFKHVALMPDVHLGKGALVGSVVATKEAIVPAAVGVDIGCGMAAIKTPFMAEQLEGKLQQIRQDIEALIPVGFHENEAADAQVLHWQGWQDFKHLHAGVQHLEAKTTKQMGSLGGGNHFIEVCVDERKSGLVNAAFWFASYWQRAGTTPYRDGEGVSKAGR
jgi:tRNA-splicing ligase RtcB